MLTLPKEVVNTVVIGIVFMAVGVFLGYMLRGQDLTSEDVRSIVNDEVTRAMQDELGETLAEITAGIASNGIVSGEGASPADIQALIDEAVAESERQRAYKIDDDPSIGPDDAPVVIVEFSDFFCSFCGRHFDQTLTPILETYDGYVQYVYRDFPGVGGDYAVQAAMASECADEQGAFWPYHELLFDNQDRTGAGSLDDLTVLLHDFAADLDLDMDAFRTCLESERYLTDVTLDLSDARASGANGTPAFLINGRLLSGAQPFDTFANIIEAELAAQGIAFEASN